jgi:hypothetical protein
MLKTSLNEVGWTRWDCKLRSDGPDRGYLDRSNGAEH